MTRRVGIGNPFRRHSPWIAALAVTATAGVGRVTRTEDLPTDVVDVLAEEVADRRPGDERRRTLQVLAHDDRVAVRSHVADLLADSVAPTRDAVSASLGPLAHDTSPDVRAAAAHGLVALLYRAHPIDRSEIACDWTLSESAEMRAAVAGSLASGLPLYFSDLLLEHLARDPDAQVRREAAIALGHRWPELPRRYGSLLIDLAGDSDRGVRRAARRMIQRTGLAA